MVVRKSASFLPQPLQADFRTNLRFAGVLRIRSPPPRMPQNEADFGFGTLVEETLLRRYSVQSQRRFLRPNQPRRDREPCQGSEKQKDCDAHGSTWMTPLPSRRRVGIQRRKSVVNDPKQKLNLDMVSTELFLNQTIGLQTHVALRRLRIVSNRNSKSRCRGKPKRSQIFWLKEQPVVRIQPLSSKKYERRRLAAGCRIRPSTAKRVDRRPHATRR